VTPGLPAMALNLLLLFMLKEVGGKSGGELPADRGALMQKFVRSSQFLGRIARKDVRERAERCLEALFWRLQTEDTLETDVDGFTAALSGVAGVDVGRPSLLSYCLVEVAAAYRQAGEGSGQGTQHGYKYDVAGHFRRLSSGRLIWVRPLLKFNSTVLVSARY